MDGTRYVRVARAVAGFLSVLVLLVLIVSEFFLDGTVRASRIPVLLALIAGLLGIDLISDHLPINVTVESGADDE